jgi:hypothetical protein
MDNASSATPVHRFVSQRIRDWFQGEKSGQRGTVADEIAREIDEMIAAMEQPLPSAAQAWKDWNDFENDCRRHDPGMYRAMDLCKYAEWSADVALGLTDEPFSGVPRIVISVG